MEKSVFTDNSKTPNDEDLVVALGNTFGAWHLIRDYVIANFPEATQEWNFPGDKYGWNTRIKIKKRTILYLLPREGYFKVAFVFGQNAVDKIMAGTIRNDIRKELEEARVYAEGRGIQIDIKDSTLINDIKELVDIKLAY